MTAHPIPLSSEHCQEASHPKENLPQAGLLVPAPKKPHPAEILLVEDNLGDVELTREALAVAKVANRLHQVSDGEQAVAFLRKMEPYTQVPRPDLILLDLKLPRKDGREVLAEIKSDPALKTIPVIILTSSQEDEDILRAYQLNANGYIAKPVDFAGLVRVVRSLESFWLTVVVLPPRG